MSSQFMLHCGDHARYRTLHPDYSDRDLGNRLSEKSTLSDSVLPKHADLLAGLLRELLHFRKEPLRSISPKL
ncbi:hypothetical protein [Burkholderia dolosa]|uniref:hypothetical protein n=1 Tax=Burkholderia dolosa TaxID=152500 RepID=UPI001BA1CA09|nr:hypothetical protein [Burkholderia dolosa]MBR8056415.1 hypothetical protein [Burkholderia dolosa]MBR8459238.1 hypothetical protein [Burkholderia dolosa]MDN7423805.1 hypothetical protein [Burkholderia dolosa]